MSNPNKAVSATIDDVKKHLPLLKRFIGHSQLSAMMAATTGEEGSFFRDKIMSIVQLLTTMHKTYETNGQGGNAVCHLHYFFGGSDWYITERDIEDEQWQAFGFAILNGDLQCAEVGYISIAELIAHGVELDLYWAPKTLGEVKASRGLE